MSGFVESLKKASSARLLAALQTIGGKMDLILDLELIPTLDYVAKVQQLKACEVEKIYKLEPGLSPGNTKRRVYLIRSSLANVHIIIGHINADRKQGKEVKYWIIYVPRKLFVCERLLECEGLYGIVPTLEFPLGLIPVDSDMLSLELPSFFTSCYLDGNQIDVHTVAMSLIQIQELYGPIPKIFGHGRYSEMVFELMQTMMQQYEISKSHTNNISHLLIFDRDIDYTSVLLTQLNYEGLLDETFDIKSGSITFTKEATGNDQPLKIILNNDDPIYSAIRNRHFSSVLAILKAKAQQLQVKYDKSNLSIDDMKEIIAHKKTHKQEEQLLPLYIHTCEVIIKQKNVDFQKHLTTEHNLIDGVDLKKCHSFIEDAIITQIPAEASLRLLCLLSLTQDGISFKDYQFFAKQFLQSYGHKHLITIDALKKLGLFTEIIPPNLPSVPSGSGATASKFAGKVAAAVASFPRQSSFKVTAKKLSLIPSPETVHNLKDPSDMSYVFSGAYTPLIAKLTEQIIMNDGFSKLEDAMKLLPGSTINHISNIKQNSIPNKVVLVYVLGGITYAETAALRFLAKSKGFKVIIASTSLINGNSLMKMLMPNDPT